MIEVHVVASQNATLYADALDQYFRCRYRIFIEEKRWADIACMEGRERDQFDDEHAVYLLAIDNGVVLGGQRFYPTEQPHMMTEVFSYLTQWPIPQRRNVWEATRYCIARDRRVGRADAKLLVAMQRYCLDEGIEHLTGVITVAALSRWLEAGFRLRPLGLPQDVGGEPTLAVIADITPEGYAKMLSRLGTRAPALIRQGLADDDRRVACAA